MVRQLRISKDTARDEDGEMDEWTLRRPWWRMKRFAAAFLLWLLVIYPLSYGPAFGLWWRSNDPVIGAVIPAAFEPIEMLSIQGPRELAAVIGWYRELWLPAGWNEPICGLCLSEGPPTAE